MRKFSVLAIFLAAACGRESGAPGDNAAATGGAPGPARGPVQIATLTGLYESAGPSPSQLCITEQGGTARFGLVTRGNAGVLCSGAGTATRRGSTLRLVMAGESACAIEARLDGARLVLPAMPRGCDYYCSPGGGAESVSFAKTGGTREDALRAQDPVGGPLCA
ncbi:MAG TPA: hypothetical protein VMG08_19990 [Allosphingosinicella sp.]|nr:hypothetical protein [Allosphingosinicella sp.]